MPCKGGQKCAPKSTTPTSAVAKNAHRSIIRGCDVAVHSSFDIVAFACSNSAPKFRPKPASRCTNAVQRWLETRTKIDHLHRMSDFRRVRAIAPPDVTVDRCPSRSGVLLLIIPRTKDQNQGFSPSPPSPLLSASPCANPFARTSLQAHKNPPIPIPYP